MTTASINEASREAVIAGIVKAAQSGKKAADPGVYGALVALLNLVPVIGEWQSMLAEVSANLAQFTTEISQQESAQLQEISQEIQNHAPVKSDDEKGQKELKDLDTRYQTTKVTFDNLVSQMQGIVQAASGQATNTSNSQQGIIQEAGVIASNFWKVLTG